MYYPPSSTIVKFPENQHVIIIISYQTRQSQSIKPALAKQIRKAALHFMRSLYMLYTYHLCI
jgi:hypothetical protein